MKQQPVASVGRMRGADRTLVRVIIIYLLIGTAWILFSDRVLSAFVTDPDVVARLQSAKGLVFVALVGLVIFLLLRRAFRWMYAAHDELERTVLEKEVLLREVHHRVKNNLAVVTGLVRLQLNELEAADAATAPLAKTRDRMEVMGLIHNMLYQEQNLARIEFNGVLARLVSQLHSRYGDDRAIHVTKDLDEVYLDVGQALPLGLIANEAITNAFTHAFGGAGCGTVGIHLEADVPQPGRCRLVIADDGEGLPAEFVLEKQESLGFRMMAALAGQLSAELSITGGSGTRVSVVCDTKRET